MNTIANQRERNLTRIRAHLLFTIRKTISLLEYQGTKNHQESLNFLTLLETAITTESKGNKHGTIERTTKPTPQNMTEARLPSRTISEKHMIHTAHTIHTQLQNKHTTLTLK
jgi:hypothetical protein